MPFTMQDGYKSNSYLTISVRDNARITCEELKNMAPTELTKLWKVSLPSRRSVSKLMTQTWSLLRLITSN